MRYSPELEARDEGYAPRDNCVCELCCDPRDCREQAGAGAPSRPRSEEFEDITRSFVVNVILPVWLAAGVADWVCHRRTQIERTTGPKESLIHLGMLTEAAIPVLCGMFLEVTSPVRALAIAAALLHDATALWDVSYAATRREVTPIEQHVLS